MNEHAKATKRGAQMLHLAGEGMRAWQMFLAVLIGAVAFAGCAEKKSVQRPSPARVAGQTHSESTGLNPLQPSAEVKERALRLLESIGEQAGPPREEVSIPEPWPDILEAYVSVGAPERALEIVSGWSGWSWQRWPWRYEAMRKVVRALTQRRGAESVIRAAARAVDAPIQCWILTAIAHETATDDLSVATQAAENAYRISQTLEKDLYRNVLVQDIVHALKRAGNLEKADEMAKAEGLPIPPPPPLGAPQGPRPWDLINSANTLAQQGKKTEARKALEEGLALLEKEQAAPQAIVGSMIKAASIFAYMGERAEALRILEEALLKARTLRPIGPPPDVPGGRALAGDVVEAFAKMGEFNRALEATEGRYPLLTDLARLLADLTQNQWALEALSRAIEAFPSASALPVEEEHEAMWNAPAICALLVRLRETDQALRFAKSISLPAARARALARTGVLLAQAGKKRDSNKAFQQAIQAAEKTERYYRRADVFYSICQELCKAGDLAAAGRVARRIEDARYRSLAFSAVAKARQESTGDKGVLEEALEALKAAEQVENAWDRASAISNAATKLVAAGHFMPALDAVERALDKGVCPYEHLGKLAYVIKVIGDPSSLPDSATQKVPTQPSPP